MTRDPEHLRQRQLLAEARAEFLSDVPLLRASEVEELLRGRRGEQVPSVRMLTHARRLFAVRHRGTDLYPAGQIVDGEPSPAIEGILEAFEGESAWSIALWLNAPCGWLGGRRPLELLADQPDRVTQAAIETAAPFSF